MSIHFFRAQNLRLSITKPLGLFNQKIRINSFWGFFAEKLGLIY